jgi:hypothetical protein
MEQPLLLAGKDASPVEGKRWLVLLVFSWIEFNQVLPTPARSLACCTLSLRALSAV